MTIVRIGERYLNLANVADVKFTRDSSVAVVTTTAVDCYESGETGPYRINLHGDQAALLRRWLEHLQERLPVPLGGYPSQAVPDSTRPADYLVLDPEE